MTDQPKRNSSPQELDKSLERLSFNEELGQKLVVVDTQTWIATLTLVFLIGALLLWSIFGNLSLSVSGKGIIAEKDKQLIVYGFVPLENAQRIHDGLKVFVELSTVNAQEFGRLEGHIQKFTNIPLNDQSIYQIISNNSLQLFLLGGMKAPVLLEIVPEKDPKTPSGYKWTTGNGPPFKIDVGTTGNIKVVLDSIKPLYYVFPSPSLKSQG
jgi:hypothetical protein